MSKTGEKVRELAKEIFNIGYEAGVKACNTDCAIVWEDRIDAIKAEILSYKDDKIIHTEQNAMIDIVLEIIDRHLGSEVQENE